jgi:putative DNA primase/helicase
MAIKKSDSGAPSNSERNSLQQARPRERKRPAVEPSEAVRGVNVNAIRTLPVRQPLPARETPSAQTSEEKSKPSAERSKSADREAKEPKPDGQAVPDHVRRRFVQVGRKYYFPDGARAFTDRGHRLTTASENTEVIKSLVDIAKSRGWEELVVHGSERFRREAWFAAKTAGIEVRGYRASEFEEGRLVRMLAERSSSERRAAPLPERSAPRSPKTERESPHVSGTLLEHGRAPYKQDPKEPMSYFVRLRSEKGERTLWGVDLERAFKESYTQPKTGDVIGLVTSRKDPVKVKVTERDGAGHVSGEKSLETHRNRWLVEKQEFFEQRTRAAQTLLDTSVTAKQGVKSHPELVGTYLQVRAAELAAKTFKDPENRKRFVDQVRSVLAQSVASGEPLPKVQIKDKAPQRRSPRTTDQAPAR